MIHDDDKLPKEEQKNEDATTNESTSESTSESSANTVHETASQKENATANSDVNENSDETTTEKTWHNKNAFKRGIAMLGFGFIAGFVRLAITLIAVFQFFALLIAEKPNKPLVKFGQSLNTYAYQINQFLTINCEVYPFPFADWPAADKKKQEAQAPVAAPAGAAESAAETAEPLTTVEALEAEDTVKQEDA